MRGRRSEGERERSEGREGRHGRERGREREERERKGEVRGREERGGGRGKRERVEIGGQGTGRKLSFTLYPNLYRLQLYFCFQTIEL